MIMIKLNWNTESLDKFCGSPFWNSSLTWYTINPDFTTCFEKTVLVLIPTAIWWLFLPLEIYWLKYSPYKNIRRNWKNLIKLSIGLTTAVISALDFFSNFIDDVPTLKVDVYMPFIKMVTFLSAAVLVEYNRKHGIQASGHQFIFWFLSAVCGIPQFRTEIRNIQKGIPENIFFYWTFLTQYPLIVVEFLLNFLADDAPEIFLYGKVNNPSPMKDTNFFGRIFYTYYDKLLYKGFKRPLEHKDMWSLDYDCQAKNISNLFEGELLRRIAKNKEKFQKALKQGKAKGSKPKHVSVLPIMYWCFWRKFLMGAILRVFYDFIVFINPQILSLLIAYVTSDEPRWKGLLYAFSLFTFGTFQTIMQNVHFTYLWYFGLRTKTCLISCIYRKALRISNAARKDKTIGEIVNLMAADSEKFQDFSISLLLLWSGPIQIILAVYFLWQEVGPSVLAGFAVILCLIPINVFIVKRSRNLQIKQMKHKDERVKMMNEIVNGIKVLKLYAWESSFEKIVENIRLKEIATLLKDAYLSAGSQFLWNCAPFIVAFATFGTYVLLDENNTLNASKAFVSLALLNILRQPMNQLPNVINNIVQTMVSLKRINSFLNATELEPYVEHNKNEDEPLLIEDGNFSWDKEPTIKNINFTVKTKTISAIVGPVGSGKSSLINALLGEMKKLSGRVNTYGSIAYVSQQAWIQNATVRENIVFGKSYDKVRYQKVLEACALMPDLQVLADGDMTEIGEKGINLSGGQKQRVSLARAVYEDADIYLLDDPLSAVDSYVGKHIFTHVIGPNGLLQSKARVLVTHAVTYLLKTDKIYVMNDGEIKESGSYKELLSSKGAFAEFLLKHINDDFSDEEELKELEEQVDASPLAEEIKCKISRQRSLISESSSTVDRESIKNSRKSSLIGSKISIFHEKGKLIGTENAEKGNVKLDVFKYYFEAIGLITVLGTILFYLGFQGFDIGSNIWLGKWSEDENMVVDGKLDTRLRDMYLLVYASLGIAQGFCIAVANVIFSRGTTRASRKLHNILMGTVMRLPMAFFDVTPSGRILARFSNDIIGVDMRLPRNFNNFFFNSFKVLGTIVVICFTTPLFTAVIIPVGVLYIFIQRYFVASKMQIKRLESVSRSPIYSHFAETISGTTVIRAYGCQDRFIADSEDKIDKNQVCAYPSNLGNRWLSVRLETIGNIIILASALFAVLSDNLNGSMVGLSVSYALQITQTLNILVRTISEAETSIVAVERIKEYSEVKTEKPWNIPEKKPKETWPELGTVEFRDYSVRYRPGLDLVLKNVNFTVKAGEKIGIVGRTGAGKSSLTLSLFRIIEASGGTIYIDGINISEIGLNDLRSKLTIIPQDAVLFSGNLRMNLDPFELCMDEEVWKSVEHAHLKDFISSLPAGLYHKVAEGGVNLSAGERQLICLARALLRKTKILILDEATASVDLETDELIQKTIRTQFYDCTIITIAHRLNTIVDSTRVLVLDQGQIAEFDNPKFLMGNKDSIFYRMCKDAGLSQ